MGFRGHFWIIRRGFEKAMQLQRAFFQADPVICAEGLIGCELVWGETAGRIVETEAYLEHGDQASHTFLRLGAREFIERHLPGTLYVYLNYGVHWLLNFLVKGGNSNGFVLIRALEPTAGLDLMAKRRQTSREGNLCSGPGKLTQALSISGEAHGQDFFQLKGASLRPREKLIKIETDRRVGITKSAELEWRFLASGSPYVSVPKTTRSKKGKTRPRAD
jgi:DNA-3-methyladenine glycosylase